MEHSKEATRKPSETQAASRRADSSCTSQIFTGCSGFLDPNNGSSTTCSSARGGNADDGFQLDFNGTCAVSDNRVFRVRVRRFGADSGSCTDYRLAVSFTNR